MEYGKLSDFCAFALVDVLQRFVEALQGKRGVGEITVQTAPPGRRTACLSTSAPSSYCPCSHRTRGPKRHTLRDSPWVSSQWTPDRSGSLYPVPRLHFDSSQDAAIASFSRSLACSHNWKALVGTRWPALASPRL